MLLLYGSRHLLFHRNLLCCHPGDFGNLLLETADAGFTGVFLNDFRHRRLVNLQLVAVDSVLFQLFREEEFLGDFHLLLC